MKVTNLTLEKEEDFAFIYNAQMCNVSIVSNFETFELEFIWESEKKYHINGFWSDINEVYTQVSEIVFNALDYLLENSIPMHDINGLTNKMVDISKYNDHYITVEFINDNLDEDYYGNGMKGRSLMVKISEYKKLQQYRKLQLLVPNKEENKTKSKGKI